MKLPSVVKQFSKYIFVGGLAFLVDFGILLALTEVFGLYYLWSASISFVAGVAINYCLCIFWIFDQHNIDNRAAEFLIFLLIGIAGLVLNNLLMFAFTELFGFFYLVSKAIAAALILCFNFFLRRTLLFADGADSTVMDLKKTPEGTLIF